MDAWNRVIGIGVLALFGVAAAAASDLARSHRDALDGCVGSGTEADINAALVGKGTSTSPNTSAS
jgi:hypothetical protein